MCDAQFLSVCRRARARVAPFQTPPRISSSSGRAIVIVIPAQVKLEKAHAKRKKDKQPRERERDEQVAFSPIVLDSSERASQVRALYVGDQKADIDKHLSCCCCCCCATATTISSSPAPGRKPHTSCASQVTITFSGWRRCHDTNYCVCVCVCRQLLSSDDDDQAKKNKDEDEQTIELHAKFTHTHKGVLLSRILCVDEAREYRASMSTLRSYWRARVFFFFFFET